MGQMLELLCAAVEQWDARSGVTESDGTGAWHVLGYLLERPEWRALVEPELQELPTLLGMRRCLSALLARGSLVEAEVVPQVVRAVDAQLEGLSEDHAKVVRRRRLWLAETQRRPDTYPNAEQTQALLATEAVWEEMRRYRVYLAVWRDVTAGIV